MTLSDLRLRVRALFTPRIVERELDEELAFHGHGALATPAAEGIGMLVHAFDPLAYASGLGVIIVTCLVAAFVPARRLSARSAQVAIRMITPMYPAAGVADGTRRSGRAAPLTAVEDRATGTSPMTGSSFGRWR